MRIYKLREVFIAGGQPELTYVPREHLRLEDRIAEYLDEKYKVLSISGPTKSGKTVLARKVMPKDKALWISGGQIQKIEDFWSIINERTASISSISEGQSESTLHSEARIVDVSLKPGGLGGAVTSNVSDTKNTITSQNSTKNIDPKRSAISSLISSNLPIVIDDFHYIDREIQTIIIRSLKEPVFDGLATIFISVPHRSFDAVRVE